MSESWLKILITQKYCNSWVGSIINRTRHSRIRIWRSRTLRALSKLIATTLNLGTCLVAAIWPSRTTTRPMRLISRRCIVTHAIRLSGAPLASCTIRLIKLVSKPYMDIPDKPLIVYSSSIVTLWMLTAEPSVLILTLAKCGMIWARFTNLATTRFKMRWTPINELLNWILIILIFDNASNCCAKHTGSQRGETILKTAVL